MSNEEDREALSKLIQDRSILWRFQADGLTDAILAAGFHRAPAPAPNVQALIADARSRAESLRRMFPNDGETWDDARLVERLADAIETLQTDLDARFEHSDHLSAKYYQRMRAAEKAAGVLASESADFERERDEIAAEVERLKLIHVGQARLAMLAVYLADVDGGTQAFYREWVRNHDAALIESLFDGVIFSWHSSYGLTVWDNEAHRDAGTPRPKPIKDWLRDRARQVREGEA